MATVTYDPQADALGISFANVPSEGEEVYPGVILHFDAENRVVEIEILRASKVLAAGVGLERLPTPAVAEMKRHTINDIKLYGDGRRLLLNFDDDDRRALTHLVDLSPLLEQGGAFEPLRDPQLFDAVKIGPDGRTLLWHVRENIVDLGADALWLMAHPKE